MSVAAQFRVEADTWIRRAQTAPNDEIRALLFQIANTWMALAERIEQLPED